VIIIYVLCRTYRRLPRRCIFQSSRPNESVEISSAYDFLRIGHVVCVIMPIIVAKHASGQIGRYTRHTVFLRKYEWSVCIVR
jgi:hypothetical protein